MFRRRSTGLRGADAGCVRAFAGRPAEGRGGHAHAARPCPRERVIEVWPASPERGHPASALHNAEERHEHAPWAMSAASARGARPASSAPRQPRAATRSRSSAATLPSSKLWPGGSAVSRREGPVPPRSAHRHPCRAVCPRRTSRREFSKALTGKVNADFSNPFNSDLTPLVTPDLSSAAQEIAKVTSAGAHVVEAFSTVFGNV